MVRSVMQYLHTTTGITVIQVNVTLPAKSYMAYANPLQAALSQYGSRVRCVIFSHISSVPAIIEPVKELAGMLLSHCICFLSVSLSIFINHTWHGLIVGDSVSEINGALGGSLS